MNTTDEGDETVTDDVTGIIWTRSPDLEGIGNGDGEITSDDKLLGDLPLSAADSRLGPGSLLS